MGPVLTAILWYMIVAIVNVSLSITPHVQFLDSPYSIPGQFVAIDLPVPTSGLPSRIVENSSCHHFASFQEEPYTDRYFPRENLSLPHPWTEVKRSLWAWEGRITRAAFDAERTQKVACTCEPGCDGCHHSMHYKIVGGRLWTSQTCDPCAGRRQVGEEVLKVALYLFPLPDMEFLLHFGDGCNPGRPTISLSICRNAPRAGFAMPTYGVWRMALGPSQMAAYHACLWERYPPNERLPLAVWRGSSTNPGPITQANYMQAARVRLHLLSREHPDLLDAKITRFTPHTDPWVRTQLERDIAPSMATEDFNRYCAVLHLQGNGWSERLGQHLIHYPTPLLRIATNTSAFFEHLFAPDVMLQLFKPDFSDLLDKVRRIVADCKFMGGWSKDFEAVHRRMQNARALMDQVGIAQAMAYTLMAFKNATDFEPDISLEGFTPVNMTCCSFTRVPPRFAQEVSAYSGRHRRR